ncbi:MAG: tetratricopeptide repeat protein [Bacteroidota bacterium]
MAIPKTTAITFFLLLPILVLAQLTPMGRYRSAMLRNNYPLALRYLNQAQLTVPKAKLGNVWYEKGVVLEYFYEKAPSDSLYEELRHCYKKAISLSMTDSVSYKSRLRLNKWDQLLMDKGKEAYGQGDYRKAIEWFQKFQLAKPGENDGFFMEALCTYELEDWDRTKVLMNDLLDSGYRNEEVYRSLIHISRFVENDTRKAVLFAADGLIYFPDEVFLRKGITQMLVDLNDYSMASSHAKWLMKNYGDEPENIYLMAVVLHKTGRHEEAIQHYQRVLESPEKNFEAWYNLGGLQYDLSADAFRRGEMNKGNEYLTHARNSFEAAYAIDSRNADVVQNLVTLYRRLDNPGKAELMSKKLAALRVNTRYLSKDNR